MTKYLIWLGGSIMVLSERGVLTRSFHWSDNLNEAHKFKDRKQTENCLETISENHNLIECGK